MRPLDLRLIPAHCRRATGGFTLLEVLVALAILSIVMAGVMGLGMQRLRGLAYAEEKVAAVQLAGNLMQEFRLDGSPTDPLTLKGAGQMGGYTFDWRRQVVLQQAEQRYQINLELGPEDAPVHRLIWYVSQ